VFSGLDYHKKYDAVSEPCNEDSNLFLFGLNPVITEESLQGQSHRLERITYAIPSTRIKAFLSYITCRPCCLPVWRSGDISPGADGIDKAEQEGTPCLEDAA
jgi:hypothetical protein